MKTNMQQVQAELKATQDILGAVTPGSQMSVIVVARLTALVDRKNLLQTLLPARTQ